VLSKRLKHSALMVG